VVAECLPTARHGRQASVSGSASTFTSR
jgi:hypothetical protein